MLINRVDRATIIRIIRIRIRIRIIISNNRPLRQSLWSEWPLIIIIIIIITLRRACLQPTTSTQYSKPWPPTAEGAIQG